eukprot:scaffold2577_cov254-Pinguiococcus_pyrenoidosus.AAC.3
MAASEAQILIVFDYDWSLVNENSDTYVVAQLAPELQAQIFQERPAGEGWVCFCMLWQLFSALPDSKLRGFAPFHRRIPWPER